MLLGNLRSDDADVNDSGKKAIDLDLSKTTTLHVHHAFLYISLPSLHDFNVKVPNFTFYRGREQRTTTFCNLRSRRLEVGARKKERAREGDTRGSLSRAVLSCAHYFKRLPRRLTTFFFIS